MTHSPEPIQWKKYLYTTFKFVAVFSVIITAIGALAWLSGLVENIQLIGSIDARIDKNFKCLRALNDLQVSNMGLLMDPNFVRIPFVRADAAVSILIRNVC